MLIATLVITVVALIQQPAPAAPKPEIAAINAKLGSCSADFTVKDVDGKPVYAATVHVKVRYGFLSLKRMDLEVGTNVEGKARVEGLPSKAKPLAYDVTKADKKGAAEQDLTSTCQATLEIVLK